MRRRAPAPRFHHPDAPKTLEEWRAREAERIDLDRCLECGAVGLCDPEPEHRRHTKRRMAARGGAR